MTHRERFLATMRYEPRDRCPLYDFNFWNETLPEWHAQGLDPQWNRTNIHRMLGLDASIGGGEHDPQTIRTYEWCTGLNPVFGQEIVEDLGDEQIVRQPNGVMVRVHKRYVSIPPHVGHTLVDRASWREHYLPRLQPDNPGRLPEGFAQQVADYNDPDGGFVIYGGGGSLFGWLRDWMGLENIALVPYDDPAWFEEMVTTIADVSVAVLEKAFAAGARVHWLMIWEDMCFNSGPLLGPEMFKQYLVPQYKRITELCRRHGCEVISVDCDGRIDALLPLWLEAGVNCMFPIEIGDWADPCRFRAEYGRDCRMMGGFDKHILTKGPAAIDAEIERLTPLVEEGGYIPFCDHRVPPDVPLAHYIHYCDRVRAVWGRGVNLPEKIAEPATLPA